METNKENNDLKMKTKKDLGGKKMKTRIRNGCSDTEDSIGKLEYKDRENQMVRKGRQRRQNGVVRYEDKERIDS